MEGERVGGGGGGGECKDGRGNCMQSVTAARLTPDEAAV